MAPVTLVPLRGIFTISKTCVLASADITHPDTLVDTLADTLGRTLTTFGCPLCVRFAVRLIPYGVINTPRGTLSLALHVNGKIDCECKAF